MGDGYVLFPRALLDPDCCLMRRPPLYFKLWSWLLVKANFRDRSKLRRGQLLTTIDEMRQAMAFYIGYRRQTPSRDEIRNAYEALTKATMITTARTTRGIIITICNYDEYQDFKSYEAHDETHDENTAKHQPGPSDTENIRKQRIHNKSTVHRFTPPAPEEVRAYCEERRNGIDPQQFIDHYEARGWIPKGYTQQMKCWKAAVRTWERNGMSGGQNGGDHGKQPKRLN